MTDEHPQRTPTQNNALHKYFEMVATALNEGEHFMAFSVGTMSMNRRWTGSFVKEFIWRPLQYAEFGSYSTTKLKTIDPSAVYDHMNAFLSTEFGIHVPWPDRFSQAQEMATG